MVNPEKTVLRKIEFLSDPHLQERVMKFYEFSKKYLSGFLRRTGENYFQHGLEVALTVMEVTDDPLMMSVAMIHDLQVNPEGDRILNNGFFTEDEKNLIHEMHILRRLHIDENTNDLDLVLESFSKDPRLLPLRMAHRVNDVRHLDRFAPPLRKEVSKETFHMYTAIAGRLGLNLWRYEIENICFKILYPDTARRLQKKFEQNKALDELCMEQTRRFLMKKFREQGIEVSMDYRIKDLYSTYRKMLLKHRKFEELTDRLAIRIFVNDDIDCYRALFVVHRVMHPIPGKLKDYIGAPKENGYRSLHTVVYPLPGVSEQAMEIQIRTYQMHQESEFGLARHSTYKDLRYALRSNAARVNLFSNLEILRRESHSPRQFEQALRTYFSEDRLVVFDHKNNLYHLKSPANVLDFACLVYGKKWMKLKSVKMNGRIQPLDTKLQNGDVVELKFSSQVLVTPEWINACYHRSSKDIIKKVVAHHQIQPRSTIKA